MLRTSNSIVLVAILAGCAATAPSRTPEHAPVTATTLVLPEIAARIGGVAIRTDASPALRARAESIEALLREPRPIVRVGLPAAEGRRDLTLWLEWLTSREQVAAARASETCSGCGAREGVLFLALAAIERDHLLRSIVEPELRDARGAPLPPATIEDVRQMLRGLLPETVFGNAILALDLCRGAARQVDDQERVVAFCTQRRDEWTAMIRPDTDAPVEGAPEGPAECWTRAPRVERRAPDVPAGTRPIVIVTFANAPPLDRAEQRALRERLRTWVAERVAPSDVESVVDVATIERWEQRARDGVSVSEESCAVIQSGIDALSDAAPATWVFAVSTDCDTDGCTLTVQPSARGVPLPESLRVRWRASVGDAPERAERWVEAVGALTQEPRAMGAIVATGPLGAPLRVSDVLVLPGLRRDEAITAAIQGSELAACGGEDDIRVEVSFVAARDGTISSVGSSPWERLSPMRRACVERALRRVRLPAGDSRRVMATLELAGQRGTEPEDPRSRFGRRIGAHRVRVRAFASEDSRLADFDQWLDGTRVTREAMAHCLDAAGVDDAVARRVVATVEVGGDGRPSAVRATAEAPELAACMEERLRDITLRCPTARVPATVQIDVCGFREAE